MNMSLKLTEDIYLFIFTMIYGYSLLNLIVFTSSQSLLCCWLWMLWKYTNRSHHVVVCRFFLDFLNFLYIKSVMISNENKTGIRLSFHLSLTTFLMTIFIKELLNETTLIYYQSFFN